MGRIDPTLLLLVAVLLYVLTVAGVLLAVFRGDAAFTMVFLFLSNIASTVLGYIGRHITGPAMTEGESQSISTVTNKQAEPKEPVAPAKEN